jgi:diguanylate cyclase (GGDEF)-like protein
LREESIRDPLTGLYNRRYLDDALEREFSRAKRDNYPVGIIMMDIDHFKKVNDTYGHIVGDVVLQKLAQMLGAKFRREDIICRFGGEEFLVVMPETSANNAFEKIEDFRKDLENIVIEAAGQQIKLTISGGVAMYPFDGIVIDDIIQSADQAMYKAKAAGRNQVIATPVSI